MCTYSLSHLGDRELLGSLTQLVVRDRKNTAALLAHLAEVEDRRLYAPAGYPSMSAYCTCELNLSEQAAFKRINAARTARQFPELFGAVADGRLHLSAVLVLSTSLTKDNAAELIEAASHKSRSEIEQMLAERFPQPDVPEVLKAVAARPDRARACQLSPGKVQNETPRPRVKPLAPERFALQMTISKETHDKLQYARDLMSHAVPSGDLAHVFDRALDALITKLEKAKYATSEKPRRGRGTKKPRAIPAAVKREVHRRDGGRCTFVSESGKRCESRKRLEFDHIEPVAKGGESTAANLRLRCRAHNQLEADQAFGPGFMHQKRERARQAKAEQRTQDVISCLRTLGYRAGEAKQAAAFGDPGPNETLESRVRRALGYFRPRTVGRSSAVVPVAP